MSSEMYEHMRANPKFQKLVAKRGRFAWTLAFIVLGMFYGFVVTIGVAFELFMFIFFWVLTAVYVRKANGEYDELTADLIKDAWKENK